MSALDDKIRAVLAHSRVVRDLVEIYIDSDDHSTFSVGFVESVGSETACFLAINENGEFDGRLVSRLDEIFRVHVGGDYLESLKILHESRGKVFDPEPLESFNREFLDLTSSLGFAKEQRIMVTVHDYDDNTTLGFVSDMGEDWVQVEPITRDGRSNGFTIFRVEDIVRVDVGGRSEQARAFVHQSRLGR